MMRDGRRLFDLRAHMYIYRDSIYQLQYFYGISVYLIEQEFRPLVVKKNIQTRMSKNSITQHILRSLSRGVCFIQNSHRNITTF